MADGVQYVRFRRVSIEVKFIFDRCGEGYQADESVVGSNLELSGEVFYEVELFVEVIDPFTTRCVNNKYDISRLVGACWDV